MRKAVLVVTVACLLVLSAGVARSWGNPDKKDRPPLGLKIGDTAPDFTLLAFDGKELKKVSLSDYRGKRNVALAFYVFAFTGG
jgi:hypothetical protein